MAGRLRVSDDRGVAEEQVNGHADTMDGIFASIRSAFGIQRPRQAAVGLRARVMVARLSQPLG